jgi:tripartite-type tricarboxylate transporter receptor subunit TctC
VGHAWENAQDTQDGGNNAKRRALLEVQGFEPDGGTPAVFAAYIKSEITKWARVIKDAGIPAE